MPQEKLKYLGVSEKRGRPAKSLEEKYSSNHVKFTAMLNPENVSYLKQLKTDGIVESIPPFLDMLINTYRDSNNS